MALAHLVVVMEVLCLNLVSRLAATLGNQEVEDSRVMLMKRWGYCNVPSNGPSNECSPSDSIPTVPIKTSCLSMIIKVLRYKF